MDFCADGEMIPHRAYFVVGDSTSKNLNFYSLLGLGTLRNVKGYPRKLLFPVGFRCP